MTEPAREPGQLFLVPTPLDFGIGAQSAPLDTWLPPATLAVASRLRHWITENAKSTRAFLNRVNATAPLQTPLQEHHMAELPRAVHKKGDHAPGADADATARLLLAPAVAGHDIGLVSEAGMPAVADPGSSVVRAAHALGLKVTPLVGPVSLMLALAASGLNGQSFAFVGYVPQEAAERSRRVRELEQLALKTGQTQIVIETPYRNEALLQALLKTLQPHTRLAVATGITVSRQGIRSGLVSDWKRQGWATQIALDLPAVFLFGR